MSELDDDEYIDSGILSPMNQIQLVNCKCNDVFSSEISVTNLCRNRRRLNQAKKTAMAPHCHCAELEIPVRKGAMNMVDVM